MKKMTLKHEKGSYEILIEKGIFKKLKERLDFYSFSKCFIITDKNVNEIYKEEINKLGLKTIVVNPGEKSKSLDVYKEIIEKLIENDFNREDMIITLGGGVVGDLGGFIASTLLRGVRFIQVPTTLLSQVDSSIGGKVAVNSKNGKNLIGSFYHPVEVIIDPEFILTLPEREIKSGMGELIKYGLIKDKNIFEKIEIFDSFDELFNDIENVLYEALLIKKEVVELDEFDRGIRMILNFGHTIGHGIEKSLKKDQISHGEAVAIGMKYIIKIFEDIGKTKKGSLKRVEKVLEKYNLNDNYTFEFKDIFDYIKRDKKIFNNIINIIVLKEIGKVEIKEYKIDEFKSILGVD